MDTTTVALGLGGLVATLASSVAGLYFTASARAAPFRQHLYQQQLAHVTEVLTVIGRFRLYASVLTSPETVVHHEQAREDARVAMVRLSELGEIAAAVLPTDLFVEVRQLGVAANAVLDVFHSKGDVVVALRSFSVRSAKTAVLARSFLGIDELSEDTARLAVGRRALANVRNAPLSAFSQQPPADDAGTTHKSS